ncbi:hypothetical protein ACFXOM_06690 [Streptomyces sp. NPDC059169]|uniref:hypothetical protein n=1 Tax=Streptomyces sp. NPDC059169 TaxID=3346754 RepID=UPI0036B54A90
MTVVLFAAGCAGKTEGPGADEGGERSTVPAAADKVLEQQELQQAMVTQKDLPGHTFDALPGPAWADNAPVTPAVCRPVNAAVGLASPAKPKALVKQVMSAVAGDYGGSMALASYAPDQAREVIAALRTALRSCTAFTPAYGFAYEDVVALPDPGLGSESVSFRLLQVVSSDAEKSVKVPVTVIVVRQGAIVATFQSANIRRDGPAVVPPDVVSKQLTKLAEMAS